MLPHFGLVILEGGLFALAAGLVYGIFGGGSGLFLMPGFYFLLQHFPGDNGSEMQFAIATTAATSVVLGLYPCWLQFKKRCVDVDVIKKVFPGILTGTILAITLLNFLGSGFLKHLFGVAVILVAVWFLLYNQAKDKKVWQLVNIKNYCCTGVIGLLWFLLGIAVFTVPYLHKCGIDMRRAVGTGTIVSTIFSLIAALLLMLTGSYKFGFSIHHFGYVNTTLLLIAVIPSIIGGIIGAKISHLLPQQNLKRVYACLILVIGVLMLV
jgi:uncharacterized membrane protein YfcA